MFNVLVILHGMVPELRPKDLTWELETYWERLAHHEPALHELFGPAEDKSRRVFVQWGHQRGSETSRRHPDQALTGAQQVIYDRVSYDAVRTRPGPNNILLTGLFNRDYGLGPAAGLVTQVKEEVILCGLTDALYYCSPEGEGHVRRAVYGQVLGALQRFDGEEKVQLHVVAHSLGVTVAHDFLFGLFSPDHTPDYLDQGEDGALYQKWRTRAAEGKLLLGSFVSMASQLPLFVHRKQALVEAIREGKFLDPHVIGLRDDRTRWLLFYDMDDILGFPTRELYLPNGAMKEIQVNNGPPWSAHTGYLENQTVIRETARLLLANGE